MLAKVCDSTVSLPTTTCEYLPRQSGEVFGAPYRRLFIILVPTESLVGTVRSRLRLRRYIDEALSCRSTTLSESSAAGKLSVQHVIYPGEPDYMRVHRSTGWVREARGAGEDPAGLF
jgi:hypothetical protein